MYPGFIGTVLSHFLSLISTLFAIIKIHNCNFHYEELYYIRLGLFLVAENSALALVRYGCTEGYKLRRIHIIILNISVILNFTIIEAVYFNLIKSTWGIQCLPILNIIPLLSNISAKDYRIKIKHTDFFVAINALFLLAISFLNENYYGVAFSASYFFGYFFIGESGYFFDTEVPAIDAFQYLTCFLNYFTVQTLCY